MGWLRGPRVEELLPGLSAEVAQARSQVTAAPLWLTVPMMIGLLLAGGLLCGGLLFLLKPLLAVVPWLGLPLLVAAAVASWLPLPWLSRPVVLVASVVGRGLFWFWVFHLHLPVELVAAGEAALLVAHRDPAQRWFAAAMIPAWLVNEEFSRGLWVLPPTLAVGAATLAARRSWSSRPAVAELLGPAGSGLLFAALVLPSIQGPRWPTPLALALGVTAGVVAGVVAAGAGARWPERVVAVVLPIALGALAVGVPGLVVAVLVAVVGFAARSPATWTTGIAAMVGYGVWFYYQLSLPLFQKGAAMIVLGAALAATGAWAHRRATAPAAPAPARDRAGAAWAALGVALAVLVVVGQSARQELRLARSEVVYLALAPRDPRSLVQGDYQRLRYELTRHVPRGGDSGTVVVTVDEAHVATFARVDDGAALGPHERAVRWERRGHEVVVASNAWLFQEGTGHTYDVARYGIVALDPSGGTLLLGLADEGQRRLGPPRRLW
jgi:uncharacterized membrane-anchored protein